MARTRKVSMEGGALYEVAEYDGKYWASKVKVEMAGDFRTSIGSARSLDDALALIKAHSGKQVRSIS
jgi:hypothetical protein